MSSRTYIRDETELLMQSYRYRVREAKVVTNVVARAQVYEEFTRGLDQTDILASGRAVYLSWCW